MKKWKLVLRIVWNVALLLVFLWGFHEITHAHEVAAETMATTYIDEVNFVPLRFIYIASAAQLRGILMCVGSLVLYAVHNWKGNRGE